MFTLEEILEITRFEEFKKDYAWVQQSLVSFRAKQAFQCDNNRFCRLSHFVECVLASAVSWKGEESEEIGRIAGQISELLSLCLDVTGERKKRFGFRAALLYELGNQPALSSAILNKDDMLGPLTDLFFRDGIFKKLGDSQQFGHFKKYGEFEDIPIVFYTLSQDVIAVGNYAQGLEPMPQAFIADKLAELSKTLSIGLSSTELSALTLIFSKQVRFATRSNIDQDTFQHARKVGFPVQLWPSQVKAINGGLLNKEFDSWGFAAPTGTGKTFLTRLLIIKELFENPNKKVLYIVPSRALVYEVSNEISKTLHHTSFEAGSISPQLLDLDNGENAKVQECSVIVLTPEKADLLLRLGSEFMDAVSLIIVDEAHHIESGTRGVLLELYLWRIRKLLSQKTRIIFLSAVAPNIEQLAEWMGARHNSVVDTHRSTRMRVGVYRIKKHGNRNQGWVDYSDNTKICFFEKGVETGVKKGIVQLSERLSLAGPVLVVAKGKRESENLAQEMLDWLKNHDRLKETELNDRNKEIFERLDSRLEREMYTSVLMRKLIRNRIAYHHAGLPPRVRLVVEEAIKLNLIDYVFATTTLAEGVNFPFSSVIVESLALREPPEKGKPARYHVVTPRSFWNIAGRAGRPGFDKEGQVILFEPSLGLDKVNAVLEDYLDPSITSIKPVGSAMASCVEEILEGFNRQEFTLQDLNEPILPAKLSKNVQGTVNLLRVGLIHSKAIKLDVEPKELIEGSFAVKQMNSSRKRFAIDLVTSQSKVVNEFFKREDIPPIETVAELGVSIETLTMLCDYVSELEDWQIRKMDQLILGGKIYFAQVKYVIGPVASRMAELEGPKLGGFYTDVIIQWLSGVPLSTCDLTKWGRLENLISVIYSRIQYLLPWGLYAMDKIVEVEAKRRDLSYSNDIGSLAYLVDAGVPNFDALRLVGIDFERVDAARLSVLYQQKGGLSLGVDIIGWLINEKIDAIEKCVKGFDYRRLDYDLNNVIQSAKKLNYTN